MNQINNISVLLVKAREHKVIYSENVEDIRMGYVDSVLKKNGIKTSILDFAFSSNRYDNDIDDLHEYVRRNTPNLIVFFIDKHPTNSPYYTLELIDGLLASVCSDKMHISVYGDTQIDFISFFDHKIDSVILGEEDSVLSMALSINNKIFPENVKGIVYCANDSFIETEKAELINDLDILPFPTRYALGKISSSQYAASILSSRGCFGKCSYCHLRSKEKYFQSYPWRGRSIINIVDEMEELYRNHGIKEFFFVDEEFLLLGDNGFSRASSFATEIIRRKMDVKYSIYSRSDCITEEIVQALAQSGLYCVFLGIESFSQDVLNRYNKLITVETNFHAINILKKHNIHIRLGLILFDMDSTIKEFKTNLDALKRISESKSELLFQSMFFSNALIPLADTPSCKIQMLEPISQNVLVQENYFRRSRTGKLKYGFSDMQIDQIYTCIENMSEALLYKCIEKENQYFCSGYTIESLMWFKQLTKFSIKLLHLIYEEVVDKKTDVEICNKIINDEINKYSITFAC